MKKRILSSFLFLLLSLLVGLVFPGKIEAQIQEGDPCNPQSSVVQCGGLMTCDPNTRTCKTPQQVQVGTPCNPHSNVAQCGGAMVCDPNTRTCEIPKQIQGSPCNPQSSTSQCGGTMVCNPSTKTCELPEQIQGSPCDPQSNVVQCGGIMICDPSTKTCIKSVSEEIEPYALCNQIPEADLKADCENCLYKETGVWTAVGCIPQTTEGIAGRLIKVGTGIAGGVALIMILVSGFMFSTSQGEPKRTSEAKEILTSAVIGLLFIIFSVTILQFIGLEIFKLPGFGGN